MSPPCSEFKKKEEAGNEKSGVPGKGALHASAARTYPRLELIRDVGWVDAFLTVSKDNKSPTVIGFHPLWCDAAPIMVSIGTASRPLPAVVPECHRQPVPVCLSVSSAILQQL